MTGVKLPRKILIRDESEVSSGTESDADSKDSPLSDSSLEEVSARSKAKKRKVATPKKTASKEIDRGRV